MSGSPPATRERIVFLDYLRVLSCYAVILIHSTECYYIGEDGYSLVITDDSKWAAIINSLVRCCVPVFVMITGYLMVPLKTPADVFFKRRFSRIAIPLVVWLLLYSILPLAWKAITVDEMKENLIHVALTFPPSAAHLWYVYMILGVYMFIPIISPWLAQTSEWGEIVFLAVWAVSTIWHYMIGFFPDGMLGSAVWNEFHMLYNFSGFIGYIVLAHYIRVHINWSLKWSLIVGGLLFATGYGVTAGVFYYNLSHTDDIYSLEVPWRFCTFFIVLMAFSVVMVFKALPLPTGRFYKVIQSISKVSYGVYLVHLMLLSPIQKGLSPYMSAPWSALVVSIVTFVSAVVISELLSLLPFGISQVFLG